jgi:hypothetical protein
LIVVVVSVTVPIAVAVPIAVTTSGGVSPPNPGKECIRVLAGLSSTNLAHWCGMKGLMWGARGPFPPAMAMVVMIVVGSWLLGHISTVEILYIFYGINLFFGLNI